MTITVSGRKMPVTDALRQYAEEKVGNAIKADGQPTPSPRKLFFTPRRTRPTPLPAICEVTVRVKGHIVRVEESEEDMYAAIDVAPPRLPSAAQVQDRVLDKKVRATERIVDYAHEDAHRRASWISTV